MAEQPPATSPVDRAADHGEGPGAILPKIVRFTDLTRCGDELWIEHSGQLYRLRQTRQGKLILTK
jgi:hemin uptake protein HemP